jgi:hypothetical protein
MTSATEPRPGEVWVNYPTIPNLRVRVRIVSLVTDSFGNPEAITENIDRSGDGREKPGARYRVQLSDFSRLLTWGEEGLPGVPLYG